MEKEELQFQKRMLELAKIADQRCCVTFTDFMNINELNMFYHMTSAFSNTECKLFGGYDYAERQIVAFIPDALSYVIGNEAPLHDSEFPIAVLKVSPSNKKFADTLTHRDYLGALLNLGVERCKLGDIIICGQDAYFFCMDYLKDFFINELTKVKHTTVMVTAASADFHYTPKFVEAAGSVASNRIDSVIAFAYSTARSKMTDLIAAKKVFVNSKLILSNSYTLKEEDIVSVRGFGKFIYKGVKSETKKGRFYITIMKYD